MNLPLINACLNGFAAVLLSVGLVFILRGNRRAHQFCMGSAFAVSVIFLISYLYHKLIIVRGVNTPFPGPGVWRPYYLAMLISHILLAIAIVPLALRTLWLARCGDFQRHRRMARWTWPLWMYVSITGVLVYLCLYVFWNRK